MHINRLYNYVYSYIAIKYAVSYVPGERSNEVILPASVISLAEPDLYDFVNHMIHRK